MPPRPDFGRSGWRRELKADMDTWGGALMDRMSVLLATQRLELQQDLARAVRAISEDLHREMRMVDEKYADLPGRVAALEERS